MDSLNQQKKNRFITPIALTTRSWHMLMSRVNPELDSIFALFVNHLA
jgi:hypothetical protein